MERRRSMVNVPKLSCPPLKIIVGKDGSEETLYLHDEQATKFSDVIAAAVKSGFQEAEERTVKFPEDDPGLFRIFAGFMYSGAIHSQGPEGNNPDQGQEFARLANLWVLGEKLQARELKDAAVDAIIEMLRVCSRYPTTLHQMIYPKGLGPSGMRRLCVDIAVWQFDERLMANLEQGEEWGGFFFDLAVKLKTVVLGGRLGQAPYKVGSTCRYHDHGSEKACYRTMFS